MKLKNIAYITAICVMIFSVLGTVAVFAPPQGSLLPAPIEVINSPDSTLAVTTPEGQSLDVTLDEPIEVVNDEGDSLDVSVNNFPDSIDVENTLDVSGWLHTTESGSQIWTTFGDEDQHGEVFIDTEGYREITIAFDSSQDSVDFGLAWSIDGVYKWAEGWNYGDVKLTGFTTPYDTTITYFFKTYNVQGEILEISWFADGGILSSGDGISILYYMTT
jgi:hypothetical protein